MTSATATTTVSKYQKNTFVQPAMKQPPSIKQISIEGSS